MIELMVTVAIVALLATIALPIYARYIERSCRSEAKTTLYLAAQFMERFASINNGQYTGAQLPAHLKFSKTASGSNGFSITLNQPTTTPLAYTLTAARVECQAVTGGCSENLILNELGFKGTTTNSAASISQCWNR